MQEITEMGCTDTAEYIRATINKHYPVTRFLKIIEKNAAEISIHDVDH